MAVLIQYCTSFIDKKNVKDENRISHYNQRPKLNIQYTAYPVSSLNLLASYRPLLYIERPDSLFFSKLSSSGFFCPGRGLSVTCVSCDNSVELIRFVSEPSSAIYHKPGCEYIKEDNNDVSSNNVLPQTSIPQPSSVPQDTNSNAHSNAVSSRSENNQTPELLVQASSENTSCNHHETNQQVSSASSDLSLANPSYPVYSEWSKRMTSFVNWPGSHDLSSTELVNAGFFYAGYSDCVRCFYCGLGLRSWKPGDDIYVEHERYRPTCSYLQTLDRNRPQNSVNRNRVENGADNINSERESVSSRANVTEPTAASIQRSFDSDRRLLSNNVEVTQHEVTQNEITQHEVTHNEVIQNEVTQHEVTQNEIIQHEVTHNEVIQNEVTQHEVTQNEVPVTHNEVIQHEVRRAPDNSSTSKSENRNFQNVTKTLLQRENQALKQLMKCKACNVAPIQDLFLPCGEMYTCKDCSNKFIHCPSCGKRILGTVTVYFT
ncbi:hypothetical protein Btru_061105 [Bulinus truncatus]|nr:hypothetical protein Btru_061105 [Bulinus truncatus]